MSSTSSKPTQMDVEKFTLQARVEHRRRVEAIMRRGLMGRALDTALKASEAKRDRAIRKFREGGTPKVEDASATASFNGIIE